TATPSARFVYGRAAGSESCPDETVIRQAVSARVGYAAGIVIGWFRLRASAMSTTIDRSLRSRAMSAPASKTMPSGCATEEPARAGTLTRRRRPSALLQHLFEEQVEVRFGSELGPNGVLDIRGDARGAPRRDRALHLGQERWRHRDRKLDHSRGH